MRKFPQSGHEAFPGRGMQENELRGWQQHPAGFALPFLSPETPTSGFLLLESGSGI